MTKLCLCPTRESLDFLVKLRTTYATTLLDWSVSLLKWARENNRTWSADTCFHAALDGHLPVLQYLHENGCPWDDITCRWAACNEHWDCLQYAVDNKCPEWKKHAKKYAKHLR